MFVHRNVLFACFTMLTHTELTGVNLRFLFSHTVVVTVFSLDPRQVLQNRVLMVYISLPAVLRLS